MAINRQSAWDAYYNSDFYRNLQNNNNSNPNQFGASGRGEVAGAATEQELIRQNNANSNSEYTPTERLPGESDTDYRSRINNQPFLMAGGGNYGYMPIKTLSAAQSAKLAKDSGLEGLGYDETFGGLTDFQAREKVKAIKSKLLGQTSENTSSAWNTDFTSGIKKYSEGLQAKLQDTMSDTWLSNGTKEDKKKVIFESTASQIAKLFPSVEEFQNQYNSNLQVRNAVDAFASVGGDVGSITAKITDISQNPNQEVGNQDLSTYLSKLNPNATPQEKKAFDLMLPERELAQMEIVQLANIPKEFKDLYFGSEDEIGILQEKKLQAEETKKLIEKKAKAEEKNLRAQAQFAIDQNNADMEIASAQIEENRLQSKNYMTGMLAKLGALNTTGAAPKNLANLEQKYQAKAQQLRTKVDMANRGIEIKLNEAISDVELQKEEEILNIQADLTLDKEEVYKEMLKLEANSSKQIFDILGKYVKEFRTQSEKYRKEAEAAAKKYTKDLASTISIIDLDGFSEGTYFVKGKKKGVLLPDGSISPLSLTPTQQQDVEAANIRGADAMKFFLNTEPSFRDELIRMAQTSDIQPSLPELRRMYNEWVKQKEDSKKTTTKKTTSEITLDDF